MGRALTLVLVLTLKLTLVLVLSDLGSEQSKPARSRRHRWSVT
jgi:hypothetical protein